MLYQVGDRVRVRPDLMIGETYVMADDPSVCDEVVFGMHKFAGEVVTIKEHTAGGKYRIVEGLCFWTDGMFDGLEDYDEDFEFDLEEIF